MKLFKKGSVKDIIEIEGKNELEFNFSDRISVFDKIIPSTIPYKGETLCRTAVHWFDIAEHMGYLTHYKKMVSPTTILAKRVRIVKDYNLLTQNTTNYLIPIEFIARYYVAGFLYDRLKDGTLKPETLGFEKNHMLKYGEKLPRPFFETGTKLERFDTFLSKEKTLEISGLTEKEYERIKEITFAIDEKISYEVEKRGLIHVDGKKEFAIDERRNIMIIDVFGTADEDRFWDQEKYEKGECIELSKEFVRQYYRKIGYKDKLYSAREQSLEEPEIPPLTEEMIETASKIYIDLFERITGKRFR